MITQKLRPGACLTLVVLAHVVTSSAHTQGPISDLNATAFGRTRIALGLEGLCDGDASLGLLEECTELVGFMTGARSEAFDLSGVPSVEELLGWRDIIHAEGTNFMAAAEASKISNLVGTAPPFSLPLLAVGFVDFLIERSEQELMTSFYEEFLKDLLEHEDLKILLPETSSLLRSTGTLGLNAILPTVKASSVADLSNLPLNITSGSLSFYGDAVPDGVTLAGLFADVFARTLSGTDPLYSFADVMTSGNRVKNLASPFALAAATTGVFAREVLTVSAATGTDNITLSSLLRVADDAPVFAAFVMSDLKEIVCDNRLECEDQSENWLPASPEEFLARFRTQLSRITGDFEALRALLESATQAPTETHTTLHRQVVTLLSDVGRTALTLAQEGEDVGQMRAWLEYTVEVMSAIEASDWGRVVVLSIQRVTSIPKVTVPTEIPKFLAVAVTFANAEKTTDVQEAIRAIVDPVGGFRARRGNPQHISSFTTSIVSYLGVSGGGEWVQSSHGTSTGYLGAFAPLGFELAWGFKGGSFGIYIAPLDFGTVASYRLSEESDSAGNTIDDLPDIGFANIIAPSIHLTFGITERFPATVGLGGQFAPQLRKLDGSNTTRNAFRVSLFFGLDMTLMRFH